MIQNFYLTGNTPNSTKEFKEVHYAEGTVARVKQIIFMCSGAFQSFHKLWHNIKMATEKALKVVIPLNFKTFT